MRPRRLPLRQQLVAAVGVLLVATGVTNLVAHHPAARASKVAADGESSCAGPRWPVKTLADPEAASVDLVHVQPGTVAGLRALAVPPVDKAAPRVPRTETALVRVTAALVSGRVSPDGDLALVIGVPGSPDQTMTVEFPDPRCLGAGTPGPARTGTVAARQAVERACGRFGATRTPLSGTATLTGVRFVDTPHELKNGENARQAAPNEVELHPVVAVGDLSCRPTKHPPATASSGLPFEEVDR